MREEAVETASIPPYTAAFHQFPLLPTEIRCQIWKLSLAPRIIDASLIMWDRYTDDLWDYGLPPVMAALPPQFHACQESRREVSPLYCSFEPVHMFYVAKGTFINFNLDILYCADELFRFVGPHDNNPDPARTVSNLVPSRLSWNGDTVSQVTKLAIVSNELKGLDRSNWQDLVVEGLKGFRSLREIVLFDREILEGLDPTFRDADPHGRRRTTNFKGPVEFMEEERWEANIETGTGTVADEFAWVLRARERLRMAELEDVDGWKAPEITRYYRSAIRWKNGKNGNNKKTKKNGRDRKNAIVKGVGTRTIHRNYEDR